MFVAGESLILAGNAAGLEASVPSYVGGISLWAACSPPQPATVSRQRRLQTLLSMFA